MSGLIKLLKRIYDDGELLPEATIKKHLTVQTEGDRSVSRNLEHYNLQMIIAVGFKVNNPLSERTILMCAPNCSMLPDFSSFNKPDTGFCVISNFYMLK